MDWLIDLPTPLFVGIIITAEFGIIALVLFVLQKFGVKVFGGMPKAAWLQGLKNAFFTLAIMAIVVGGIALIPILIFRQSVRIGFSISLGILWIAIYVFFLFAWFSYRQKAGRVLLDVMPFPSRPLLLVTGSLIIIMGFFGAFGFFWKDSNYALLISIIFGLSLGSNQLIMSLSRVQIRENGILAYVDLIKWSKIESFEWVQGNEKMSTIKFRYKGRVPTFLRNGAIPIPIEKQNAVDSLLKLNLPNLEKSA